MTTLQQIELAQTIIATGLVKKVFHSCEMIRDPERGPLYPAYFVGNEFVFVGPDDTEGLYAYIRANGDYASAPLKLQSCAKAYDLSVPLRVVFFSDEEKRDRNYLLEKLATFAFLSGVTLVRVIDDKFRLIREEANLFRERFDAKTFYIAYDILVKKTLLPSDCEAEPCKTFTNPICQP